MADLVLRVTCSKCEGWGSWPKLTRQVCPSCGGMGFTETTLDPERVLDLWHQDCSEVTVADVIATLGEDV